MKNLPSKWGHVCEKSHVITIDVGPCRWPVCEQILHLSRSSFQSIIDLRVFSIFSYFSRLISVSISMPKSIVDILSRI